MRTIEIQIPEPDEVTYTIECRKEHLSVKGNAMCSGHAELDKQVEDEILNKLTYNEWAWCCVRVIAKWKGLEGDDYLGACSYESEEEFMKDGYYEDMKDRAYQEIVQQLTDMAIPQEKINN